MKARQGKSFKTTLDFEVQKYTSDLLKDKAAAVCVMDVYNGDIVSLVSSPTFEPNEFVHGLDKTYWNSLLKNEMKPLTNKTIAGLYTWINNKNSCSFKRFREWNYKTTRHF